MGYRSRGKWVITGSADDVTSIWAAARLEVEPYTPNDTVMEKPTSFNDFTTYTIGNFGYIRFSFEDWKWYGSYPSIRFYERVWEYLSKHEDRLSGKRVHIGEDNDVSEMEFGDYIPELAVSVELIDEEPQPPEGEPTWELISTCTPKPD